MISIAQKTIILADSSKFGKKGFGKICGFEDVDEIITDKGIPATIKSELESLGVKITIV
jgi:DeoR family transcriptional regulator of aga operon